MSDSFTGQQINASIIRLTAAQWAAQSYVLPVGVIGIESDTGASKVGDGETAWGALPYAFGTPQLYVAAGDDPAVNGQNLLDAYAAATALTPNGQALSEYNRVVLIIPPGFYEMPESLALTTPYVDFVGLTSNSLAQMLQPSADAVFGAIEGVSAGNGARFYNLSFRANEFVDNYGFNFDDALSASYFENCTWINNGESGTGMGVAVTIASTFFNCTGGHYSFGGGSGTFSGTATNCAGGNYSFGGGVSGECSGTVRDCIAGTNSFGGGGGTFSGTATNCAGGNYSFGGGGGGTFSGTATNCTGGSNAFGGGGGGTFKGTGRLAYSRLTAGSFPTPATGGKIVLCINGSWAEVNAAP